MNEQISDESFAAYLDGNTSSIENLLIETSLGNNENMAEAADIMSDMSIFFKFGFSR